MRFLLGFFALAALALGMTITTSPTGELIYNSGNVALDGGAAFLFGPIPAASTNPWPFYETAAAQTAGVQIANKDITYAAFWNTAGPGTVTVTTGTGPGGGTCATNPTGCAIVGVGTTFTTTFCQGPGSPTVPISGVRLIVWYPLTPGSTTYGRRNAGYPMTASTWIQSCTDDTHMTLKQNAWTLSENPGVLSGLQYSVGMANGSLWGYGSAPVNYYDNVSAFYAEWYRTGNTTYYTEAGALADKLWNSPDYDHGNAFDLDYKPNGGFCVMFRCFSTQGLVLRALDGHPEMWPGLHKIWQYTISGINWLNTFPNNTITNMDAREWGYGLAQLAQCAQFDIDPTWQSTCRSYIKRSFMTAGTGYLNVWPMRQRPNGGWEQWFTKQQSFTNRADVTNGSASVVCHTAGTCHWQTGCGMSNGCLTFPGNGYSVQNVIAFTSDASQPADNANFDADAYCYIPGGTVGQTCTVVDDDHITLDRTYVGTTGTKGWVIGYGPAAWGQEPFFEGILGAAFDLAGRAMSCTSPNVPVGCDNPTAVLALAASDSAAQYYMQYGYWPAAHGAHYVVNFAGCQAPIAENNQLCNSIYGYLGAREFAMDGFKGLMFYYNRTRDPKARTMLDTFMHCLWSKPGTGAIGACPDATTSYDSSFNSNGNWSTPSATTTKIFGQCCGWGGLFGHGQVRQRVSETVGLVGIGTGF